MNEEKYQPKNWKDRGPRVPIGCFSVFVMMTVLVTFALVVFGGTWGYFFRAESNSTDAKLSTTNRVALEKGAVTVDVGYFTDELGWIDDSSELKEGMKYFYDKTGVMPYLWITDEIDGETEPKSNDFSNYANKLYDELFEDRDGKIDEAHLLVLFHEYYSGEYTTYYIAGRTAQSVIDEEAGEILLDQLDRFYESDLDDEEYFAKVFTTTADSIMKITRPNWYYPGILALVLGISFIVLSIAKARHDAKKDQAMLDKEILNTPLEKFGSKEAEELARKYEEINK